VRATWVGSITTVCIVLAFAAPVAAKREPFDYGPLPNWTEYKRLGEAALRAALPDQEKWAVEWPNGVIPYTWDHKGNYPGYMTCGIMRAIAPVTKRHPVTPFIVVIDRDKVIKVDIGQRALNSAVPQTCTDWVATGKLPPARLMEASVQSTGSPSSPSGDVPVASLGLTVRPMPEGAYIIESKPGSAGARAGLTAGTVITSVNDVPLTGMGAAMVQVLGSDMAAMRIETAAGARIELGGGAPLTSRPK
jgi:hypothetical protein